MKQKYKLLKEYPNHQIGDIAEFIQNPGPVKNEFYWIKCSGDPDIPMNFWPIIAVDWWEKVEDEKSLEDYEKIVNEKQYQSGTHYVGLAYLFKHFNPRIYWTEVLRCIAKDLNKDKMLDEYKYHILRTNDRVWTSTVSEPHSWPGLISFIRKEDCQKAIDLLNNNLKYLFNEE